MQHILSPNDNYFHLAGGCNHNALHQLSGRYSVRISSEIMFVVFLRPSNKCRYSTLTRPWPLPSKSVPIHYSSIVLPHRQRQKINFEMHLPTDQHGAYRIYSEWPFQFLTTCSVTAQTPSVANPLCSTILPMSERDNRERIGLQHTSIFKIRSLRVSSYQYL